MLHDKTNGDTEFLLPRAFTAAEHGTAVSSALWSLDKHFLCPE
jgi:hypothetical protein